MRALATYDVVQLPQQKQGDASSRPEADEDDGLDVPGWPPISRRNMRDLGSPHTTQGEMDAHQCDNYAKQQHD